MVMNKKLWITLLLCVANIVLYAQQTIYDTIVHDNLDRSYILYVPDTIITQPMPLVINMHGYSSNATEQMFYGDFRPIADTAGFILVHPMGTNDISGNAFWNAGFGGSVDDIGFLESLIDTLSLAYNIDTERVYATGMSNGGFMSYTLACELSHRIAAIASVTGTMSAVQIASCAPARAVPIMEIHGTADNVVPYNGNILFAPIPEVLTHWRDLNECDETPIVTDMPDLNTEDGCTAQRYEYLNGRNGSQVLHYKILGGGHTWPGSAFDINNGNTNHDIMASIEIWNFFNKYDINGLIEPLAINTYSKETDFTISPNPSNDMAHIKLAKYGHYKLSLLNCMGKLVFEKHFIGNTLSFETNILAAGLYVARLESLTSGTIASQKLIVR